MLDKVNIPQDIKAFSNEELVQLCADVRELIIDVMSINPGHFGASMGAVEITAALHKIFNTPTDQIVWDVGHQCYPHKILTGRKEAFKKIRQFGEISGFPLISESEYDAFGTGHSSTSISAALGLAEASKIKGLDNHHIAVIGDGALTGGIAFEALNNAALSESNLLIIFNDNGMSIDENVGALVMANYQDFFENLGFKYNGPINGHDVVTLCREFSEYKEEGGVQIMHIQTQKGKGYEPAETGSAIHWHAPGQFNAKNGLGFDTKDIKPPKYQDVFGETLIELATTNSNIVGVTPAMTSGSGMVNFASQFPDRFYDVGIAEQHAVTFSAGLARNGTIPFCNIYSSFMQRGYDQLIHDVALQNLHVIFCLDRAGIAGSDGATHQGVFDLAFLNPIPNLTILSPMDEVELRNMMSAALEMSGPIVIRYPRGRGQHIDWKKPFKSFELKGRKLNKGSKTAILSIGHVGSFVSELIQEGMNVSHYDMRCLKPLDTEVLKDAFENHNNIITIEDGSLIGGLNSSAIIWANQNGFNQRVKGLGVSDKFVEHGSQKELYKKCGFSKEDLRRSIIELS